MNNSVFGKTMDNLKQRVNVILKTNEDDLIKLASRATYVTSKKLNDCLYAIKRNNAFT